MANDLVFDLSKNYLLHGENLEWLKNLEIAYTGKIKCIYIDPPYNTKQKFQHYHDNLDSREWLNMMKDRLLIMHRLLSEDGSIWISIDDCECHYLKVMCDEIFGRLNFLANVIWHHSVQVTGYKNIFSQSHNYILAYRKSPHFKLKSAPRSAKDNLQYKNNDNDPKGPWCKGPVANSLYRKNLIYEVTTPSGKTIKPPQKGWRWSKETLKSKIKAGEIFFNDDETAFYRKIYLNDQDGKSPSTIWHPEDIGTTREATAEVKLFNSKNVFSTPKPERLIQRVLHLSTNPGDIVLDSFAGSGTTGAVAQKMERQWIMIEKCEHIKTHIIPRLKMVIDGSDQGGISKYLNWKGGGSFEFISL